MKKRASGSPSETWHRAVVSVLGASRREAKMTQEGLALRLGWNRTRIAKIESGERRIDVPEFIVIANGLNMDPIALLARVLRWL
jgi:transcriptional regulator with XRE-family HTH domain